MTKYNATIDDLINLENLDFGENKVFTPNLTGLNWALDSELTHQGMANILFTLVELHNLQLVKNESLYANTFICSSKLMNGFINYWRLSYKLMNKIYQDELPFGCGEENMHRKDAYLYERVTTLFFANLDVKLIPTHPNAVIVKNRHIDF